MPTAYSNTFSTPSEEVQLQLPKDLNLGKMRQGNSEIQHVPNNQHEITSGNFAKDGKRILSFSCMIPYSLC
jgi:hypothetical protein